MADKNDDSLKKGSSAAISMMREDRPLDAFFPELLQGETPNPTSAASPAGEAVDAPTPLGGGVLEVELEEGWTWCLAIWREPEAGEDLRVDLARLIRKTLLREMSRPPGYGGVEERRFIAFDIMVFEALSPEAEEVLTGLSFARHHPDARAFGTRFASWQNEARRGGWKEPEGTVAYYRAELKQPSNELARSLSIVHETMAVSLGKQLWGLEPGVFSKVMVDELSKHVQLSVRPNTEGLHALDMVLIEREEGVIRWMSPLIFQALADFLGVILLAVERKQVQWGVCETVQGEADSFYPPSFRVTTSKGPVEVDVGEKLVEFAMMPSQGDVVLLKDWYRELLP